MALLLAIDVGGTKSRIGLCDLTSAAAVLRIEAVYRNENFSSIEEIIDLFLSQQDSTVEYLCLAVAGVVENGRAAMTNLPWQVSEQRLKQHFSLKKVMLINDLTALAAVVPHLGDGETVELKSGMAQEGQTIGVIAPGTGLGQGYLVPAGSGFIIRGTEGGHAGFTPADEEELQIASWLMKNTLSAVSAEQLCSGPGITVLYRYYSESGGIAPSPWIEQRSRQLDDLAPLVVEGALAQQPCPLCTRVIERYLALLGSEAANLALKLYARGGIYIGGGVILHLLDKFPLTPFVEAFLAKEKMRSLLHTIPVHVITKKHANVYGTLHYAKDMMRPA